MHGPFRQGYMLLSWPREAINAKGVREIPLCRMKSREGEGGHSWVTPTSEV